MIVYLQHAHVILPMTNYVQYLNRKSRIEQQQLSTGAVDKQR